MDRQYLDEIISWHRKRVEAESGLVPEPKAGDVGRKQFAFSKALKDFGIIAELKRRSPSKGELHPDLDPTAVAGQFEAGGASCISVLTDEKFFGGSLEDLAEVKKASSLPILRKDFTFSVRDVVRSANSGADAILLIMAALEDFEAREFCLEAAKFGLDALFEIHMPDELQRVKKIYEAEAEIFSSLNMPLCILVNQRNLKTFEENPKRAQELAPLLPKAAVKIAASAVSSPQGVRDIQKAGYNGALIGEYLMRAQDPAAQLRELLA